MLGLVSQVVTYQVGLHIAKLLVLLSASKADSSSEIASLLYSSSHVLSALRRGELHKRQEVL